MGPQLTLRALGGLSRYRTMPRFRIFILGAGFSRPAGLPLAHELWDEIRSRAEQRSGRAGRFSSDLDLYLQFRRECDGVDLGRGEVDFEDFLAFLDVEHHLGLAGSDTWSSSGNETQVIVKHLIGQILLEQMPAADRLPDLYYGFARQLEPGDYVLTFNYDTILERALNHVEKPYRLFPNRYSEVGDFGGTVSNAGRDEVVVLKLHGSIDWFDRSDYGFLEDLNERRGFPPPSRDPVFSSDSGVELSPLVEGPRPDGDPLQTIYRVIGGLEHVYSKPLFMGGVPFLLTPSKFKAVYADQFKPYWWGLGQAGGYNLGVVVIGYSLPSHDDYAKQALFRLAHNYQESWWEEDFFDERRKEKVIVVDKQEGDAERREFMSRYGFLDSAKTEFVWEGFNRSAVDLIREGAPAT